MTWLFLAAAFLYAAFSSPTPDTPSLWEWLVISLLALAAISGGLQKPVMQQTWFKPLALLLAYGVGVATLVGVLAGAAAPDILRDLIGFAALAVPIGLFGVNNQRALLGAMLGIGLGFAARFLYTTDFFAVPDSNLLYLANSPLVAFAATWLLLHGCFVEPKKHFALLYVLLSLVPVLAMVGMMQRATLALLALVWLGFLLHALAKNPRRGLCVAGGMAALLMLVWPYPIEIINALIDKTRAVGWNTRGAELAAIMQIQSDNPVNAIFGSGWGSLFKSPAVGDQWVRFSHSFFSSLWWKAGWVGLLLGAVAMLAFVKAAHQRLRHNMVLFTALVLPLLPALFLYGSYKSLCFGLLLLGFVRLDSTIPQRSDNQTASHDSSTPIDHDSKPHLPANAGGHGQASA